MSGHTPGPWRAHFNGDCWSVREVAGDQGWMYSEIVERCPQDECEGRNGEDARLISAAPDLLEALQALLKRDEINTCAHEDTHRGGTIWEICDACGAKWADDEGGKPEWQEPKEHALARAAIAKATGKD